MMKTSFKSFLLEKDLDGRSGKALNVREAANLIFEYSMNAYESDAMLWRGSKNYPQEVAAILTQPSQHERTATTLYNVVNLLTSNFDSWKNYPKRSRSLMCGTSKAIALSYSKDENKKESLDNVWRVLPFDTAKLGVCPKDDFWTSIKLGLSKINVEEVQDVEGIIGVLYAAVTGKDFTVQHSIEQLKSSLHEIDEAIRENGYKPYLSATFNDTVSGEPGDDLHRRYFRESYDEFLRALSREQKPIWDFLEECFDPKLNGFALTNTRSLNKSVTFREIWTDGDCILVRQSDWDVVDNEIRKLLQ